MLAFEFDRSTFLKGQEGFQYITESAQPYFTFRQIKPFYRSVTNNTNNHRIRL
ncbi:hypothetical protein D3C78_1718740 [compost metagenome]